MTLAPTRIILLGRIAIEGGGAESAAAALAGRRSEIVFAYLAVAHGRSVSRDELADALWPELLPDTWNAALRGVLSDVRRFLERAGLSPAQTLVTEQGRLRLQLPPGTVVDIDEAHAALADARERAGDGDHAGAARSAGRAAEAAALPFLSFHGEGWAGDVRADLDRLHIDGLALQAESLAQAGDPRAALAAADRLVRADPFLEAAHRLRISLLGATGDRAGALKAYERCKTVLAAELGIAPSPETEAALRAAVQGTQTPRGSEPAGPPAPAWAAASRHGNLSVLVVEDHDFQRRTTLALLRGLGVEQLTEASDGTAALALLDHATPPDVIVCDVDMPGMDGVEFIRNVGERQLASAVIFASGLDERVLQTVRAASEGYGLQVLGAVGKPLTAAALERLLTAYRPASSTTERAGRPEAAIAALSASLAAGTLEVRMEPVVDLGAGRVTGFRVLVPGPFADDLAAAADAAGLGRPLAQWLVGRAATAGFGLGLDAFVELSPGLLRDVGLADGLAAISSERIVLVADAAALTAQSSAAMLDVIARLRVKGFGLCVDGFREGALERLPLTQVQLPAALVATAARSGDVSPLQPAVDASRRFGVPLLGHCATSGEFDVLLQLGCSLAHGPYLAEAVDAGELAQIARGWTAPPVVGRHG